jgi:hypothetical protein
VALNLKQKVGPLPVWGWGVAVIGVAGTYFYLHRKASADSSSDVSGSDTGDSSTIPDYSQGYDSGYGAGLTTGLGSSGTQTGTVPAATATGSGSASQFPINVGGRTIYGYGLNHEPFYSKTAAQKAGRLGVGNAVQGKTIYGYGLQNNPFYSLQAAERAGRVGDPKTRRTEAKGGGTGTVPKHPAVESGATPGYATV